MLRKKLSRFQIIIYNKLDQQIKRFEIRIRNHLEL